jgi:hypothetical protein
LQQRCAKREQVLVTTQPGAYPHEDPGVEIRRLRHKFRSRAIESFNEQFKGIFDGHGQAPTKGLVATRRYILGAVLLYQLALLHRFETHADPRVGIKPFLQAALRFMTRPRLDAGATMGAGDVAVKTFLEEDL